MSDSTETEPRPGTMATDAVRPAWLAVRGLSKTFGSAKVLRDVDFEVHPGEIHGLIGQNGSGKSTLIKVLSGVHSADAGAVIEVNGIALSNPVRPAELRRHGLAFVHQDLGLVAERTVLENIRLGQFSVRRVSRRIDWAAERRVATATLARLHAEIDLDCLVRRLPPGDRALVAIGRALQGTVEGAGCIVFDESTRALPREVLSDFYATVRRLADSGTAVIVVSHRLDEVLELTDRVSVLQDGRMIAAGRQTRTLTEESLATLLLGRELELLEERTPRNGDGPRGRHGLILSVRDISGASLRGVDLDVEPGEIVGITGATGSGAAELPYALAGVTPAVTGRVTVADREFDLPLRNAAQMIDAGIVLVPEDRAQEGIAVTLTAQENLTLPRVGRRGRLLLRGDWQAKEFATAVEMLGIVPPRPRLPCSSFSGGNQQKILLAKWLLNNPQVVVLHEPTQAVDVGARMDILRALRAAAARGIGIVISSVEPQDLAASCDRVVVLRNGKVAAELRDDLTPQSITAAVYPPTLAAR